MITQNKIDTKTPQLIFTVKRNYTGIIVRILCSILTLSAILVPLVLFLTSDNNSDSLLANSSSDCSKFDYGDHTSDKLIDGIYGNPSMENYVSEAQRIVDLMNRIWTPVEHFTMLAKTTDSKFSDNLIWLKTFFSSETIDYLKTTQWADNNENYYSGGGRMFLTISPIEKFRFYLYSHEYFHAQQHVMAGPTFQTLPEPRVWMTEGCATVIGYSMIDFIEGLGIETIKNFIENSFYKVSECGAKQETYDGVISNYHCSSLLVLTLWQMTNIYPCSSEVWKSYCTDGSPFSRVFSVKPTDVYSNVSSIVYKNLTRFYYEQVNMFNI